jgi:two-component system, OmpR family, sensor kinase
MKRKWWLMLLLAYFVLVAIVAAFAWLQDETLALALPVGDAILLAGVIIGGLAVIGIEILSLRKDRQRLSAATRNLEDVIQEQQEFRRAINHELRNLMAAISTGLERLSDECDAGTLARLKTDIERLSKLLETVNALGRIETDPIEFTPVKLDEIMQQALDVITATPAASGRKFEADLPPGPFPLPVVQGNDDLLFIALLNLLDNAIKFTDKENGKIVIRAFDDGSTVVLEVCDTGIGIREEDQRHVFKPFYRGQDAKDRAGSGLGLYQVRKIVERHGGKISIRSKLGEGTVVTIRLPVGNMTDSSYLGIKL